jgi:hypothetical protein
MSSGGYIRIAHKASIGVTCVLLLVTSAMVAADDWGTFAARSSRVDDPLLLQVMGEEDLTTKALICGGVGRREDPYAADIIGSLMDRNAGGERVQVELLLRLLLQGLFDPARGDKKIQSAISANAGVLDSMIYRIDRWADPQLKSTLVRLFPSMPAEKVLPALLTVGSELLESLSSENGLLPPQRMGLAMDYLATVEKMKCRDALDQCAALARLSREKVLVDRARSVAGVVAAN